ncbi:hypothetical protein H9M94_00840 [Mycoplasma sp. Pen4]|uniref:MAG0920 family protein n=1 Tax=Mycoplasma sp. Pen4 TaxID=640330 RepID=UPI00165496C7|nr:hypothetical protein [Mycoplasma sp. Pen4]QNM93808.1 hypothetical protein H9M94_00840 [Mycoplasma sp. Pen4]
MLAFIFWYYFRNNPIIETLFNNSTIGRGYLIKNNLKVSDEYLSTAKKYIKRLLLIEIFLMIFYISIVITVSVFLIFNVLGFDKETKTTTWFIILQRVVPVFVTMVPTFLLLAPIVKTLRMLKFFQKWEIFNKELLNDRLIENQLDSLEKDNYTQFKINQTDDIIIKTKTIIFDGSAIKKNEVENAEFDWSRLKSHDLKLKLFKSKILSNKFQIYACMIQDYENATYNENEININMFYDAYNAANREIRN